MREPLDPPFIICAVELTFFRHGRNPPFYERALLYFEDGRLLTNFSKQSLVGQKPISPRTPGIPGLSEAQAEALDALHAVGRRYEFRQSMEKGDIRFFNNLALMHRRDTYTDSPENYRHLLRLWLHSESVCWKLPADLQLAWDRTFKDNDRKEVWHFAMIGCQRYVKPLWECGPGSPKPDPKPEPPPPDAYMCD